MAARSESNMKDRALEDETKEPVEEYDAFPEAEITGTENGGKEIDEEDNAAEEEDKEEDVKSQRCQTAKVAILDISLYSADMVTDCVQVVAHNSNCHWLWATLTAVYMLLPALTESMTHPGIRGWLVWVVKDFKFRGPFSFLSLGFFTSLFTLLAHQILPEAPLTSHIVVGFCSGPLVVIVAVFFENTANTLKGFVALMAEKPNNDGSVSNPKMLDGVKGKLKEVILEAGPQSNLQVKFLHQYIQLVNNLSFRSTFFSRLGFILGCK